MFKNTVHPSRIIVMVATLFGCGLAAAQDAFPDRPVKLIVPYAAGGGLDVVIRIANESVSKTLGQPLVIENRVGDGGLIGSTVVAKSKPDGYTLLGGSIGSNLLSPLLKKQPPFDPTTSFIPISKLAETPFLLLVKPSSGITNVAQLVARLKSQPKKNSYGSTGVGSPARLLGALMLAETGTEAVHVAYRGEPAAMTDLLGEQLSFVFSTASTSMGLAQSGTLRPIAVSSPERLPQLPNVPTMAEAGHPQLTLMTWFGYFAPQGTPPAIVDKVSKAVAVAAADPALKAKAAEAGLRLVSSTPEAFKQQLEADKQKFMRGFDVAGVEKE